MVKPCHPSESTRLLPGATDESPLMVSSGSVKLYRSDVLVEHVRPPALPKNLTVMDVAPSVLDLMGLPIPSDMQGRAIHSGE